MAFYGDDFTGSTDALEFLCRSGIKTMLFIDTPAAEQLKRYNGLQAIGIAGMARTLTPEEMEEQLEPIFRSISDLNPRHIHYKVCSTFDSSPVIGSIGKAIDIGANVFNTELVPLLVAAPVLGRYCLFGNLFARMGIGSQGNIYRLDRHPSMSRHPVTPADESDLRLHLGRQTNKKTGLFDILQLRQYQEQGTTPNFKGHDVLLFDALEQEELQTIGSIIDGMAVPEKPLFSAGSSGIEMALGAHWQHAELKKDMPAWERVETDGPVLVVSGSCSAVTSGQIAYALKNGFSGIAIDTVALAGAIPSGGLQRAQALIATAASGYATEAAVLIARGKHVLLHTSLGTADPRVAGTDKIFAEKEFERAATAKIYGTLLGAIVRLVAAQAKLETVIVAGGDTSSYAARAMGIEAVEMIAPLSPGAPFCRAHAPGSAVDGLQLVFKGGQVGKEDFFNIKQL